MASKDTDTILPMKDKNEHLNQSDNDSDDEDVFHDARFPADDEAVSRFLLSLLSRSTYTHSNEVAT